MFEHLPSLVVNQWTPRETNGTRLFIFSKLRKRIPTCCFVLNLINNWPHSELSQRPQVQERLTNQIANELKTVLETEDVAVIIDAKHLCVSSRGIKDDTSATVTTYYGGAFNNPQKINELLNYINH